MRAYVGQVDVKSAKTLTDRPNPFCSTRLRRLRQRLLVRLLRQRCPSTVPRPRWKAVPLSRQGPGAWTHHEQQTRPQKAPSGGTPYAHGRGRYFNQGIIARKSLGSSAIYRCHADHGIQHGDIAEGLCL